MKRAKLVQILTVATICNALAVLALAWMHWQEVERQKGLDKERMETYKKLLEVIEPREAQP